MNVPSRIFAGLLIVVASQLSSLGQSTQDVVPAPNSGGVACVLTPKQFQDFLSLSYDDFDQDMHGGFRKFAHQGCELAAAMVIDSYVVSAPNRMNEIGRGGLLFHAGQLYAYSGLNQLAAQRFLQSLNMHEEQDTDLAWNTYVLASIAFLKDDHAELVHQRELLSRSKETVGNKMNLKVVDRFVQCFGKPYSQAYESCSLEKR